MSDNNMNSDIIAIVGEVKRVSIRGEIYEICASPMKDIPELTRKLELFDKLEADDEGLLEEASLDLMAEILLFGLKERQPDMTVEDAKQFPLSAFPKLLEIMLDMNDFLAGMRKVRQPLEAQEMASNLPLQVSSSASRSKKKKKKHSKH